MQKQLFEQVVSAAVGARKGGQLLKWIGNKQRFARDIASYFPIRFGTYFEPFLGSGAVLGTLQPSRAVGSDAFEPLIEIWKTLRSEPEILKRWYAERWEMMNSGDRYEQYEHIKASYNARPNGADLLFLCRACYGGVVRFRQADGFMSTPCGIHDPIKPVDFASRVDYWHRRTVGARFECSPYQNAFQQAQRGDLIYCDPPYSDTQSILYGAQKFRLRNLLDEIAVSKKRGIYIVLSIDGKKRSGNKLCELPIPAGLFEREIFVSCGRSMLKRFQMNGRTMEGEAVHDRLLLTY